MLAHVKINCKKKASSSKSSYSLGSVFPCDSWLGWWADFFFLTQGLGGVSHLHTGFHFIALEGLPYTQLYLSKPMPLEVHNLGLHCWSLLRHACVG